MNKAMIKASNIKIAILRMKAKTLSFYTKFESLIKLIKELVEKVINVQHHQPLPLISMMLAVTSLLMVLFWPKFLIETNGSVNHSFVTLVMLANSATFIHGIGYKPTTFAWRLLFTPLFAWPILASFFYHVYQGIL